MRSVLIALLVIILFAGGRYLLVESNKAGQKQGAIKQAVMDVLDCRKQSYNKKEFHTIREHLAPPENEFWPTKAQMTDNSFPSEKERNLLSQYRNDIAACRAKGIEKIRAVEPALVSRLGMEMDRSTIIMNRLIDGDISWGEAAFQADNLRQAHDGKPQPAK